MRWQKQQRSEFVDREYNRTLTVEAMETANILAGKGEIYQARQILSTCRRTMEDSITANDELTQKLIQDIRETMSELQSSQTYSRSGGKRMQSIKMSYNSQRSRGWGDDDMYETSSRFVSKSTYWAQNRSRTSEDETRRSRKSAKLAQRLSRRKAEAQKNMAQRISQLRKEDRYGGEPLGTPSAGLRVVAVKDSAYNPWRLAGDLGTITRVDDDARVWVTWDKNGKQTDFHEDVSGAAPHEMLRKLRAKRFHVEQDATGQGGLKLAVGDALVAHHPTDSTGTMLRYAPEDDAKEIDDGLVPNGAEVCVTKLRDGAFTCVFTQLRDGAPQKAGWIRKKYLHTKLAYGLRKSEWTCYLHEDREAMERAGLEWSEMEVTMKFDETAATYCGDGNSATGCITSFQGAGDTIAFAWTNTSDASLAGTGYWKIGTDGRTMAGIYKRTDKDEKLSWRCVRKGTNVPVPAPLEMTFEPSDAPTTVPNNTSDTTPPKQATAQQTTPAPSQPRPVPVKDDTPAQPEPTRPECCVWVGNIPLGSTVEDLRTTLATVGVHVDRDCAPTLTVGTTMSDAQWVVLQLSADTQVQTALDAELVMSSRKLEVKPYHPQMVKLGSMQGLAGSLLLSENSSVDGSQASGSQSPRRRNSQDAVL